MSIIFAGDFSTQNRLKDLDEVIIRNIDGSLYHFTDYAVINYESPFVKFAKPITKTGPNLKNSEKSLQALKKVGCNLITLANNHFRDYGDEGVFDTINECKRVGISYVGGGNIHESRLPIIIDNDNTKIGIINVCENEFSSATINKAGSNSFNLIDIYQDVKSLKTTTDFIVIIFHGGAEHFQLPTPKMKKLFHHFVDIGADVIINHHQHCYSGYEIYNDKPIFYGLGNFLFDTISHNVLDTWFYGYMVKIDFSKCLAFEIIPYTQCIELPIVQLLERHSFDENIDYLNAIIKNDYKLENAFVEFVMTNKHPLSPMLPYHNHYLRALYHRGLLPDMLPTKNKIEILNLVRCETLHECLIKYLETSLKSKNI
jgi:poly-gamma-glutamate synthesis protein (capsule biosynthesis protein)